MEVDVQKIINNPHFDRDYVTTHNKGGPTTLPKNMPKQLAETLLLAQQIANVLNDLKIFSEGRMKNEQLTEERAQTDDIQASQLKKAVLEAQVLVGTKGSPVRIIIDNDKDDPNVNIRVKYQPV